MLNPCKYLFIAFLSLIIISGGSTFAATKKSSKIVQTVGTGYILDEDTSKAKDKAIADGLIGAVESVLNDVLPKGVMVSNFKTITDILYSHTNNFIEDYKILAETKRGNDYRVMVKATVSTKKILNRLNSAGIILDQTKKHKILFLISESNLQDIDSQFWWGQGLAYLKTVSDTTITQEMQKRGFDVLSHRLVNRAVVSNGTDNTPYEEVLSPEDIINIGVFFNADIVVAGFARAHQAQNTMGENRTFTATVNAGIYRIDTAEKIATVSTNAANVNIDETAGGNDALIEASIKAAGLIASKTNIAMKKKADKTTMIEVVIEGTDFFKNYSKLTKHIKQIPEVKKLTQREKRPARAIIVVEFMGSGKVFARTIMGETFENFGLSISEVTRNHVRLEMIPVGSRLFDR